MNYAKSNNSRGGPSCFSSFCTAKPGDSQSNEYAYLEPKGKEVQDSRRAKDKLLRSKQYTQVAIMSARTLRLERRHNESVDNRKTHKISILGIADHKIVHDDKTLHQNGENITVITS